MHIFWWKSVHGYLMFRPIHDFGHRLITGVHGARHQQGSLTSARNFLLGLQQ